MPDVLASVFFSHEIESVDLESEHRDAASFCLDETRVSDVDLVETEALIDAL